MIIVAHRGNLRGRRPDKENSPGYVERALRAGVWAEMDLLWLPNYQLEKPGRWVAAHDPSTNRLHDITFPLWDRPGLIFHLKAPHAPPVENADYFCIDQDPFSLTWNGMFWVNYGQEPTRYGIMCAPELVGADEPLTDFVQRCYDAGAAGICTDYALTVKEMLE